MYCRYCGGVCVKDGLQSNKVQRYKCKECLRRQQENYRYKAYDQDIDSRLLNVGSEYEVDEMWTFLKNKHKPLWIAYALDKNSKEVISFNVGGRSIEMMTPVLDVVKEADPKKVYTDYLVHYLSLVPSHIHVSILKIYFWGAKV